VHDSDDEGYYSPREMSICWRPAKRTNKHGEINPHYIGPVSDALLSFSNHTITPMPVQDHTMESKDFLVGIETNPGPGPYNLATL